MDRSRPPGYRRDEERSFEDRPGRFREFDDQPPEAYRPPAHREFDDRPRGPYRPPQREDRPYRPYGRTNDTRGRGGEYGGPGRREARAPRPDRDRGPASPADAGEVDIRSVDFSELQAGLAGWGEPAFRAVQLAIWLYTRRATSWDVMTNVPENLRKRLSRHFTLHTLKLVTHQGSADTTQKFLWRLPDGALIESVLIPANPALYGEASDRVTLCVSTQVGCAFGCKFCASGLNGWKRNLQPFEIVEQVLAVERWHAERNPASADSGRLVDNLVIMGMGEPLANYDNLLKALRILNASWGGGIGARRITISTCGLVPAIGRLAAEPEQFGLAISLHGATNEVRDQIMPVNRRHPLEELVPACEEYAATKGRMVTLEYILIRGVNDGPDQVGPLADIARRLQAKVNLIPYNRVEGLPWERPDEAAQEAFLAALEKQDVRATLRREKGHDIDAACGQLRLRTELAEEMAAGKDNVEPASETGEEPAVTEEPIMPDEPVAPEETNPS